MAASTANAIDKAAYLKRYMSKETSSKKKRKKKNAVVEAAVIKPDKQRSKIVDDDIDLKGLPACNDSDIEIGEDAPQIVGVVEEGPVRNADLWRVVGGSDQLSPGAKNEQENAKNSGSNYAARRDKAESAFQASTTSNPGSYSRKVRHDSSADDNSPPQRVSPHESETRRLRHDSSDSGEMLNKQKARYDKSSYNSLRRSKPRQESDSDQSPKRQKLRNDSDTDQSPRRRKSRNDSDSDQAIKRGKSRNDSDSDQSTSRPKLRNDSDSDQSLPRQKLRNSDSDQSPPRQRSRYSDLKRSPPNQRKKSTGTTSQKIDKYSDTKKYGSDSDQSPPRHQVRPSTKPSKRSLEKDSNKHRHQERKEAIIADSKYMSSKYHSGTNSKRHDDQKQQDRTLDGKKAGLQDSRTLKLENEAARERERKLFEKMSDEVSGRNAEVILRDRATGKRRNLEEERKKELEIEAIKNEREAQYNKWGKGLKQIESQQSKFEQDLHEMSKPLARYKDDADLDKVLRDQERDGDPMLAFIKKKKSSQDPTKVLPKYNGPEPPPNRYGILPGYRWDGVNRSNGFEKARFTRLTTKIADDAAAYKWSVEDM